MGASMTWTRGCDGKRLPLGGGVLLARGVAGLEPGNMELTLSGDNRFLTLRGVRSEQDDDKPVRIRYHQLEVYYGPFERVIALPADASLDRDKLTAVYKEGFLKITLPKQQRLGARKITVEE